MGYESAPATKLLATRCAVCSRPLVDAISVESGMGPDCRARYFKAEAVSPENRKEANKLVYLIAARQEGPEVLEAVEAIGALGFKTLATILIKRLAKIRITIPGDKLHLKSPYSESAVALLAKVHGRVWDKKHKLNIYPLSSKAPLWEALKKAYPGMLAHGPNGFFTIGNTKGKQSVPAAAVPSHIPKTASSVVGYGGPGDLVKSLQAQEKAWLEDEEMLEAVAKADREQTEREEKSKHEARQRIEAANAEDEADDLGVRSSLGANWDLNAICECGHQRKFHRHLLQCSECQGCHSFNEEDEHKSTKGTMDQIRSKFRAEEQLIPQGGFNFTHFRYKD